MTQSAPPHTSIDREAARPPRPPPRGARQLAEWVSFGVSAAIVLALAGYLVYDALREKGAIVPLEVRIAIEEAAVANGRHVVPITVHNEGPRALKDVKVEVRQPGPNGSIDTHDFDIDYLPERSHETIYLYLDAHPRHAKLDARAVQYRLE